MCGAIGEKGWYKSSPHFQCKLFIGCQKLRIKKVNCNID